MNRWSDLIILLVASALVLSFALPLPAAENKGDRKPQKEPNNYVLAKKSAAIWLEGAANLRFVHRNSELSAQLNGLRKSSGDSTTFIDPDLEIGVEVKATRQIYGHITIRTPLYARDYVGTAPRDLDGDGEPDVTNRTLEVDEIYVEFKEVFYSTSRLRMGMSLGLKNIAYALDKDRKKGRSFFINVGQSENPYAGAYPNTASPGNRTLELTGSETSIGTTEFGGVVLTLNTLVKKKKRGGTQIDIGYGTLQETMEADDDRELMWVWITKDLVEHGRAHCFLAGLSNNPTSRIWTFGGGGTYKMGNYEIFGEAAGQIGTFLEHNINQFGLVGPGMREELKQLAAGGYVGIRYTHKTKPPKGVSSSQVGWKPFVEIKYWGLTGDSDQNNRRQQNFISLEDWDEFIVVESDEYGFDIDTNVEALKFTAGFQPYKNMELVLQYGHFRRSDDQTAGDKIGDEIDLKLSWEPDESLRFEFGAGTLLNSVFLQNMKALTVAYMSVSVKF